MLVFSIATPNLAVWIAAMFAVKVLEITCDCFICVCSGAKGCQNFDKFFRMIAGLTNLALSAIGIYILNNDEWLLVMVGKTDPMHLSKADAETWKSIVKTMTEYGVGDGAKLSMDSITMFFKPAYSVLLVMAWLPFIFIALVICCVIFAGFSYFALKGNSQEGERVELVNARR